MKKLYFSRMPFVFANDLDAYVPEIWANESLMMLENLIVAPTLVHTDFSNELRQFGDIVHTRRPANFTASRKVDGDNVTTSDATAADVQVPLDQWAHISFIIRDGEQTKGMQNLIETYMRPAMIAMANFFDQVVLGTVYEFLGTVAGNLGTAPTIAKVIDLREGMTINKCPLDGRNLIVGPVLEGNILGLDNLIRADASGNTDALRRGQLGQLLGFNTYTSQQCPSIATGNTIVSTTVNNSGGYAAGSTSIVATSGTGITAGNWITIAGDDTPQFVTNVSTNTLTITPGLRRAVANAAAIVSYTAGQINLGAGYAAGYNKSLVVDTFTVAPKLGQLVTIGNDATAAGNKYAVIDTPTTTALLLNRSLVAAVADDAKVGIGPAGQYGFAFHRNALALVMRPLSTPPPGVGARSFVVTSEQTGVSMRVTITYDGLAQATRVTFDTLLGIKVLDTNLGAVLLG